jgi:hypothetical protein
MNTNKKRHNQTMKVQQPIWQLLIWMLLREIADREFFALSRPTGKMANAPPVIRRWYGCRYGLWRLYGKPVPISGNRF